MKEQIIELRKKGKTINEIVNIVNCAKSTVSYHINKFDMGGVLNKNTDYDEVERIINLRKSGYTYEMIFKESGLSKDTIRKIFRNENLTKQCFNVKEFNEKDVIDFYLEVKSLRKTAKKFNATRDTLRKIITDKIIIKKRAQTKEERKKSVSIAVVDWRKRSKQKLVEYKGGKCVKCGYSNCIDVLEFHHIDPNEKDFTISRKSYSFEKLKKEADKCYLLCSNCHKELHFELKQKK